VSVLAAAVLVAVVAFVAVILWINSRGVFMYLDNVATGRADVARPWREHAGHASSYFAWSFASAMVTLVAVLLLVLAGGVVAVWMIRGGGQASGSIALGVVAIVGLVLALVAVAVGVALFSLALRDFAAPLQVHHGQTCGEALGVVLALVRAHPAVFLVYVLLKVGFALALAFVALVVGCCTCCLGFLPVVSQTILQPAFFFERAWPLFLLRRLGFDLLPPPAAVPAPPPPLAAPGPAAA
jgi:hypothetical protein